jgi:hypothetical protein
MTVAAKPETVWEEAERLRKLLAWGVEHLPNLGMSGTHTLKDAALIAEFRNRARTALWRDE